MTKFSAAGPPEPHAWQQGWSHAGHPDVLWSARRPRRPRDPDRDPHAFVAPLIATVIAGPVIACCWLLVTISPMATDSCTEHGCHALFAMLALAPCVLWLATASLGAAWLIPWRRRHRIQRLIAAVAAPVLTFATVMIYLHLPGAS